VAILEEYLVKLGVSTDDAGVSKFFGSLRSMGSLAAATEGSFLSLMTAVVKVQVEVVGAFASIGAAAVKLADDVAVTDQQYRLFGLSMLMNLDTAKKYKIALDALGDPALGLVRADPELRHRFETLWKDQERMQASLNGESYEENMAKMRDMHFQLTRLEVAFKYLGMAVVNGLFKAFGTDFSGVMTKLKQFADWFIAHLPEIRDKINQYLVPILKRVWELMKDVGALIGDLAEDFSDLINGVVGDSSGLDSATPKWEKFAKALEHVTDILDNMIKDFIWIDKHLPMGTLTGAWLGAKVGGLAGPEGVLPGALGGAVGGLGLDIYRALHGGTVKGPNEEIAGGITPQSAAALAQQVSAQTGIAPDLLWSQWAHETDGFKHIAAANNLAGIKVPGTDQYMSFNSLDEFSSYYSYLMRQGGRYSGIENSQAPWQFAAVLKHGGYYGDTQRNYTAGMNRWDAQYKSGSSGVSISGTTINITQPGASGAEIEARVHNGLRTAAARRVQTNLAEFQGGY
jgi:hypothetical protein